MLPSKVQTPIFARAPTARRSSEFQTGSSRSSNPKNRSFPHKTLEEANLRIVQYEIAEREACKVLASMCLEGSKSLGNEGTEYEIDDILSGILVLGNLYKRVGVEKAKLEETIESMKKEHATMEAEKNFMIERLENAILRLQMENNKLQENITEMKLKHNHKMMIAMKEINEHQENLEALKSEKGRLEGKLQQQERRLMEVPRMEEQYQRNARSIVRQQEVANTLKEIGWKKLEGEVKSLNFWKSKAKSLEETVARQKAELDNLSNQGRLSLSRYQNLLLSYNTLKRSHPHDDLTMRNVLNATHKAETTLLSPSAGSSRPSTANGGRPGSPSAASAAAAAAAAIGGAGSSFHSTAGGEGSRKQRPISAPSTLRAPSPSTAATTTASAAGAGDADIAALDELFHRHGHQQIGFGHHRRPTTAPNGGARGGDGNRAQAPPVFKKTLHHIAAEELERLKQIIAEKDEMITKLSRKLSHARAYPLKGITAPPRGYDSDSDENNPYPTEEQKTTNGKNVHFDPRGGKNTNVLVDDEESETASFMAEEDACQQKRVENAVAIQKLYNERAVKARAAQPAHIRAIRQAKSFAESVTEGLKK